MKPRIPPLFATPEGSVDTTAPFFVGAALVDPGDQSIRFGAVVARLEPRVLAVLAELASRAGETVTREQLIAAGWGAHEASDESLTETISRLRRLFGDSAKAARVIRTVPKKGYRLIAAVRAASARAGLHPAAQKRRSSFVLAAAAAAVALLSVSALRTETIEILNKPVAIGDPDPNPNPANDPDPDPNF